MKQSSVVSLQSSALGPMVLISVIENAEPRSFER